LPAARAAVITSTGGGDWYSTSPGNPWPGGIVPQPTDDAIITPNVGIYSAPVTINNLTINGPGGTFYSGENLTVSGNLSLSGVFTLQQGATNTILGNLDIGAGQSMTRLALTCRWPVTPRSRAHLRMVAASTVIWRIPLAAV